MPPRVKLCAIAKNEGAYLADWVFHHLHFGFHAIEVWVNDTDDTSPQILRRIARKHPQVSQSNADALLAECLARQENFQHAAYARMAAQAQLDGYTHVAFLDLDEYWVPADFVSSISSFIRRRKRVKVTSFQWALDVPDVSRRPFEPPLGELQRLQLDAHVKSVVRLDASVRKYREHTARLRHGVRLLVREPFPIVDARQQRHGSFVTREHLTRHWDSLPEAFVLHAINRSQPEYLACLVKGLRQTGLDFAFKPNRGGYLPTDAPVLTFRPAAEALRRYSEERLRFHRRTRVARLTRTSQQQVLRRGEDVLASALASPELMSQLRGSVRGLSEEPIEQRYPGWQVEPLVCLVEQVETHDGGTEVVGYAFEPQGSGPLEFSLRDGRGANWGDLEVRRTPRPDVTAALAGAPLDSGFRVVVPPALCDHVRELWLLIRSPGSTLWQALPLVQVPRRTT